MTRLEIMARAAWNCRMQREAGRLGFVRKMSWEKRPSAGREEDEANMRAAVEALIEAATLRRDDAVAISYLRSILTEHEGRT